MVAVSATDRRRKVGRLDEVCAVQNHAVADRSVHPARAASAQLLDDANASAASAHCCSCRKATTSDCQPTLLLLVPSGHHADLTPSGVEQQRVVRVSHWDAP
jgi:hypothetical protein